MDDRDPSVFQQTYRNVLIGPDQLIVRRALSDQSSAVRVQIPESTSAKCPATQFLTIRSLLGVA
jgi:hypothetical protein